MNDFGERYRVVRKLGQGGMAEVFLAEDVSVSRRLVVIKRLSAAMLADATAEQMFRNEMRIASQLSHPNIAQVFEVGRQADGQSFLVMEFVHGEDLQRVCGQGGALLSPPLAVFVAAQVAAGLHHAHELADRDGRPLRVVHRDVSPHNIRISYEGAVKLLDFGVAKAAASSFVSQRGSLKGKYAYMSPEQAHGHPVDARADLFSLGIVLHELLTGEPLFLGSDPRETLNAILHDPIPPPSARAAGPLPPGLDEIVLRALERDRERRFQSARELQHELEQVNLRLGGGSLELEQLMTRTFGEGRQRLAALLGNEAAARPERGTVAAIPSRLNAARAEDASAALPADDDEADTRLGYEPLRGGARADDGGLDEP